MLPWFSPDKNERVGVALLGFVQRVMTATMSCFFGCFRSKHSRSRRFSRRDPTVPCDDSALSSIFLPDDDTLRKRRGNLNPLPEELEASELVNEAEFLKACGTLLDTPVEIREGRWTNTLSPPEKEKSSSFRSWLPDSSNEQKPEPLIQNHQELAVGMVPSVETSCCSSSNEHLTARDSIKSFEVADVQTVTLTDVFDNETHLSNSDVSPEVFPSSVQGKSKSVRFECEPNNSTFSLGSSNECSNQPRSSSDHSLLKTSPSPTPLKLTDEMQTPGTVFPAYLDNMAGGKNGRIRSQYVHLKAVDYQSQWNELVDGNSESKNGNESLEASHEVALTSTPSSVCLGNNSLFLGEDMKEEDSLSAWLKPHLANHDCTNEQYDSTRGDHLHHGTTPGDRPIVGIVAVHWNEQATSQDIPPKCWDGNGIPNTTTKYKEDQKVSWHATPFEERLEKALSGESFIPNRKRIGGIPLVELNETEESDTASSSSSLNRHCSALANPKSVSS